MKLHFPQSILEQKKAIIEPFKRLDEWKSLAIPGMETPYASVLLVGRPGVGKTTLAKEILKDVSGLPKNKITQLSMGEAASPKLGETEKAILNAFKDARNRTLAKAKPRAKVPVLFLDEIEALVWNRSRVTDSSMFMLSVVNTFLLQADKFAEDGGVVCYATNHPDLLDPAFLRRMTDVIELSPPIGEDAKKVWESLMPAPPFGCEITEELYSLGWTPNDISRAIKAEARRAFLEHRNMKQEEIVKWKTKF